MAWHGKNPPQQRYDIVICLLSVWPGQHDALYRQRGLLSVFSARPFRSFAIARLGVVRPEGTPQRSDAKRDSLRHTANEPPISAFIPTLSVVSLRHRPMPTSSNADTGLARRSCAFPSLTSPAQPASLQLSPRENIRPAARACPGKGSPIEMGRFTPSSGLAAGLTSSASMCGRARTFLCPTCSCASTAPRLASLCTPFDSPVSELRR